jgi:glycosyltransferase involved in cell wall biosynthesis
LKIGYFIAPFPYPDSFSDPELYGRYPVGGTEVWAYKLAHEMVRKGHEVVVFTTSIGSKNTTSDEKGITVCRYGTNFKMAKARFSFDLLHKPLGYDLDIAHLHYAMPPADIASLIYSSVKNKPLVVTYHADPNSNYGNWIRRMGLSLIETFVVPRILSKARAITCNSTYYVPISKFLPKYQQKIVAVPPGINPQEFNATLSKQECRSKLSLDTACNVILFMGHLINYKSPDLLVKAMPQILRKSPHTRLIIAGGGPLFAELERLVKELNLADAVRITGSISNDEKILYYNAADVFVLPSTNSGESFGIVLLEAASAGLTIVVSSLSTFRAFIKDGYNGLVAEMGNVNSLAEKINQLLTDPSLRQEMGKNARASVAEFSWVNSAAKMEDVYRLALK